MIKSKSSSNNEQLYLKYAHCNISLLFISYFNWSIRGESKLGFNKPVKDCRGSSWRAAKWSTITVLREQNHMHV